jgi:hypothetical protein
LLGIMSLQALIHLSLVSPLRRSRTFINLLAVLKFFIREAENLCSSKWHCLDFIWSVINHIYPFSSHFDFIKSQKFETEFVIWKGSRSPNQVKMTQYSIFYCIIDQNGLKKSEVTKTAVLWSCCHKRQLIYQSNVLLSTAKFLACWLAHIINHRTRSDNGGFLFPMKFSHYDTPRYFQVVHGVT